jgi:hypothetical protein
LQEDVMKRRQVMKLFAVAVLATTGCETATAKPTPVTTTPTTTLVPALALAPAPAPAPKQTVRTLPNGRPACGNVAMKSPMPKDCVP